MSLAKSAQLYYCRNCKLLTMLLYIRVVYNLEQITSNLVTSDCNILQKHRDKIGLLLSLWPKVAKTVIQGYGTLCSV